MTDLAQTVRPISAVLADVDGTLVTKDKVLTERALGAVNQLRERGIVFTITSGRPPFGMRMLVEPTIFPRVAACEAAVQQAFGAQVSAARSQPYYLDVTHPTANKGVVIERLSRHLQIPLDRIAVIGDQPNDVRMFERAGLSIAMGNASDEVKRQATFVTASFADEGFANAIEQIILPRAEPA